MSDCLLSLTSTNMAAVQRLANENGNNNHKKGGKKTRSTSRASTAALSTPNSSSDSSDDDSDSTMVGYSPSAGNLTEALEDVKTSINETVSTKIDSVFEKTKKYIDKTIKPINTRLEKVEEKAAKTEDFAKKSINEVLESHKTIWVSIEDLRKQSQMKDKKAKPPASDLRKQNNLLIKGLVLEDGDTPEAKISKMFKDLKIDITGAYNVRKIPGERILVEFNSCWDKRAAYKARVKCYDNDYKGVYINEDLTEEQADLFFYARAAKKQKLVKSAWTMNGASFISKTVRGEQEMIEVTSKEHLKALIPKLRMPKTKKASSKKETKAWSKDEHEPASEEEQADPQAQTDQASTSDAAPQDKSKEDGEVSASD